ncbi:hypothetical protein CL614_02125 [archaeon]|nr:hypothetical protein [archaeon]|tara:strand:+ start:458 stop:823 length:366 start_codon:yes stop_codon:yes gene_type:complete
MFHPGRVIEVFSPKSRSVDSSDDGTQVMVQMWDENMFTFDVHSGIADKVEIDNVVLVDYTPAAPGSPVPRRIVTKILKGKMANQVWTEYRSFFDRKKGKKLASNQKDNTVKMPSEDHSYMG